MKSIPRQFFTIFQKEFSSFLYPILSYIFIVVFLVILSWLFFQNFFIINQATLRGFFSLVPWFFLFLVPALAMRTWAEEKKTGTLETLLTLPYAEWHLIAAKFLAGVAFLACVLILSLPLPISIARLGNVDTGQIIGQYIATLFLGSTMFALGQWLSSLTKNAIVSFILSVAVCFVLIIIGVDFLNRSGGILDEIRQSVSLLSHYESMARGVIDLRDVVYFLSLIFFFLFLNVQSLHQRHWK
ncbi:MAG: hypothetical protein A3B74_04830 [Candidatus Kerfeldbacteria bacterium RIFCSPHIGHO2_02_FULL_42_14]|uniref:ABC transporter n=1 Tax=Candidatus Kerfeldbacteria bacterium RIFCSPHIGHO2_02_FULL_42_14 TaxID=1798540 RepID=A0A1G2AQ36_9BACT|nr:MAG: hypothetical protein A3B74_04830 [Candidatus Kerfeldbacteria bacterium RIFCSPHIGHO2_02_FULL_42_14]OGY81045.1 MAG: hypothetical protein A3E60_03550 [Candidatus Kerfeldbacteria bacterium RIFCSPHIGHO2_12_FULL_42_13]OGY84863.1 MAG: hypothetical protein A3I91_05195 [Candidatus Kerfeldbacteria bacterium RIFCSPLOWO2_02_FULL_42_19]OGY86776.1 MAG: hypothetical protein A3G01_02495 [Candidatus Kerfeldbacteria bacterium RIFCSPLOWO2_12_FULL_43_9]